LHFIVEAESVGTLKQSATFNQKFYMIYPEKKACENTGEENPRQKIHKFLLLVAINKRKLSVFDLRQTMNVNTPNKIAH
jgi:hypothetical protein